MNPTIPLHEDILNNLSPERKSKDVQEILPADCQDAQSAPRPPIMSATWMRNWKPATPLQPLRPPLTSPSPNPIIPSCYSLLPLKMQSRRTEYMPLRPYRNNLSSNWKPTCLLTLEVQILTCFLDSGSLISPHN